MFFLSLSEHLDIIRASEYVKTCSYNISCDYITIDQRLTYLLNLNLFFEDIHRVNLLMNNLRKYVRC